jgi:hypothetical protein
VKLARLRKPKATCSPSYVDCSPKTNATILCNMGHTKKKPFNGRIGQGKETKTLNEVDLSTGMNAEILNWPVPPWEDD